MWNMAVVRLAYAAHQQAKTEMSIESHTEMISAGNEAEIAAILIEAAKRPPAILLKHSGVTSGSAAGRPPLFP
jgi:hypothetical protein